MGKADVVYKGMGGNSALINLGKKTMTGTARMGVLDMVEGAGWRHGSGDGGWRTIGKRQHVSIPRWRQWDMDYAGWLFHPLPISRCPWEVFRHRGI